MRNHLFYFPLLFLLTYPTTVYATIIHVPADSTTIQGGINGAVDGDTVMVAPGLYFEHDIDFLGKAITVTGTYPGDLGVISSTVVDAAGLGRVFIFQSGEDSTSLLAGFTITGGNAADGGGIYCDESSPTISYCVFNWNSVPENGRGGGLYNWYSNPVVSYCTFNGDTATVGGGMSNYYSNPMVTHCTFSRNKGEYGGGMFNSESNPMITNCSFIENSAVYGGGMDNGGPDSLLMVTNCSFIENSAVTYGGGMYNSGHTNPFVINCTFIENTAGDSYGGGMYNYWYANPNVTNCTFYGNRSNYLGGGMCNWYDCNPMITNCIFWANQENAIYNISSTPVVRYSDVEGGYAGVGNLDEEPRFVSFHLFDYLLGRGSPCIDSGDPSIVDGREWPVWYDNGTRSDMGAYGGPGNGGWLK